MNTLNFEQLALNTIEKSMQPSNSPFRDALSNTFHACSNTVATISNATGYLRIETSDMLVQRAQESLLNARKLDSQMADNARLEKLRAFDLDSQLNAHMNQGGAQ